MLDQGNGFRVRQDERCDKVGDRRVRAGDGPVHEQGRRGREGPGDIRGVLRVGQHDPGMHPLEQCLVGLPVQDRVLLPARKREEGRRRPEQHRPQVGGVLGRTVFERDENAVAGAHTSRGVALRVPAGLSQQASPGDGRHGFAGDDVKRDLLASVQRMIQQPRRERVLADVEINRVNNCHIGTAQTLLRFG